MRRLRSIISIMLAILICSIAGFSTQASSVNSTENQVLVSETVEYYTDGSALIISVYEENLQSRSNLYDKVGKKTYEYRNADGNINWTFSVRGEFRVIEGASVTCTSASCSAEIIDQAWTCVSKYASTSGNQAIAHGEFQRKLLGVVISARAADVTLSCDPYGNLY